MSFEQVDESTTTLGLQNRPVAEASRIDYDARIVYLFLRPDATPAERRELRELLLRSPIVENVEP